MKRRYKIPNKKIIIFTGAGISAESGISTFRDADGLWENHEIEEVCTQSSWKKNFELVHRFYNQRRAEMASVLPNRAHQVVAKIKEKYQDDCLVLTQNVDDLFERAGVESLVHLHGEATKMHCTACGNIWDIGYGIFDTQSDRCPKCNSLKGVKPHIVFFGGEAPMYQELYKSIEYMKSSSSIIVVIGTMGNIIPISDVIKLFPCKKILNNLESSEYIDGTLFDKVYYEKATTALPKIEEDIVQWFAEGT